MKQAVPMIIRSEESTRTQLEDRAEECDVLQRKLDNTSKAFSEYRRNKRLPFFNSMGVWASTLSLVGGIAQATGQPIILSVFIANAVLGITYFSVLLLLSLKK